jgi:glycine/D-amino acid oxidase-like deaminating enzyme
LRSADVLIVGAGIVGAACAREFARRGLSVAVIEPHVPGGGASAAAMGHLLVPDAEGAAPDSAEQAEHTLARRSMELWHAWLQESRDNAALAEHQRCGSLWLAADNEEMELAARKADWLRAHGLQASLIDAPALARAEPMLRPGLRGALHVPGDGRVYPPKVVASWLEASRAALIRAEVTAIDEAGAVRLADGRRLWAAMVVLAAGLSSQRWLPSGVLLPKKGQLAITQRYPGLVQHQLIELAYLKNAHLSDVDSVSFNLQPRPEGQLLIGSSRQPGRDDRVLDHTLMGRMLQHACHYLPALASLQVLRCWTGLRPATADGCPLIGAHPERRGVWLATGHEGLGITTAPASAELLADLSLGGMPCLDARPYAPARFFN